jgi:hypothetical protein
VVEESNSPPFGSEFGTVPLRSSIPPAAPRQSSAAEKNSDKPVVLVLVIRIDHILFLLGLDRDLML